MTSSGRQADDQPLAALFAANRRAFIAIAERITGCRSHAEDVVHDAFVKLLAMQDGDAVRSPHGYLARIVRNLAIDHYRRRHFETHLIAEEAEGHAVVTPDGASPEALSAQRETLDALAAALADLPPRTRYAFEMHRIHGCTQKEIADRLGVSAPVVNVMIRDTLVHIRKTLRRSGDER